MFYGPLDTKKLVKLVTLTQQYCWWTHFWKGLGWSDHGEIPAGTVVSCQKGKWLNSDAHAFLELWNNSIQVVKKKYNKQGE